jgi:hypothetical protein
MAEQQRQRFRRGQQDMRRPDPLPRLAFRWGVAGAGFDADGQPHFLDGHQQIAADIDRKGL